MCSPYPNWSAVFVLQGESQPNTLDGVASFGVLCIYIELFGACSSVLAVLIFLQLCSQCSQCPDTPVNTAVAGCDFRPCITQRDGPVDHKYWPLHNRYTISYENILYNSMCICIYTVYVNAMINKYIYICLYSKPPKDRYVKSYSNNHHHTNKVLF